MFLSSPVLGLFNIFQRQSTFPQCRPRPVKSGLPRTCLLNGRLFGQRFPQLRSASRAALSVLPGTGGDICRAIDTAIPFLGAHRGGPPSHGGRQGPALPLSAVSLHVHDRLRGRQAHPQTVREGRALPPGRGPPSPRTQTQKVARQKYLPGHFSLQKAFKAAFYPL